MKQMLSVIPQKQCPPAGTYAFNITAADPGFTNVKVVAGQQKGGHSKISLGLEIAEGQFAGYPAFDEIGTDGGTPFGSMSKKKLRQLDVPGLDSDAEIPDETIAAQLLNRRVLAICEREQQEDKDGNKRFDVDEATGLKTPVFRLRILGYTRQATGAQAQLPLTQLAPQGFAPQGYPQQFQQPQPVAAPGSWPGGVPGGYAPPAPGAVPGGYAPQAQVQGFPQVAPPPGWGQPNGAAAPGLPQAPQGVVPGYPGAPGQQPR
jgi:hypothetical protein